MISNCRIYSFRPVLVLFWEIQWVQVRYEVSSDWVEPSLNHCGSFKSYSSIFSLISSRSHRPFILFFRVMAHSSPNLVQFFTETFDPSLSEFESKSKQMDAMPSLTHSLMWIFRCILNRIRVKILTTLVANEYNLSDYSFM